MKEYTCLVVDDSPMMRQMVVFALARMQNISVTEADNGIEALKKLATQRFDLIIADINMPLMDGIKLVRWVRADVRHKDVPVLIISTESALEDRERAMAMGASAYITKPLQAQIVVATVAQLLDIA
jgi:two-component system chemotaxis response regulator CheY